VSSIAIATLDWSLHIPEYNCTVNSLDLSLLSDLSPLTDLIERKKKRGGRSQHVCVLNATLE